MLYKWKRADVDDKRENNINAERQKKSPAASNYRHIICLPLVWKLLTGVIAEENYGFLDATLSFLQ